MSSTLRVYVIDEDRGLFALLEEDDDIVDSDILLVVKRLLI